MPTMRRFLKHILPSVFDDTNAGHTAERDRHNADKTPGTWSRKRKQYEQFPESVELQLVPRTIEEGTQQVSATVVASGDVDNNSDKAILETKSYTVQWDRGSHGNSSSETENKE